MQIPEIKTLFTFWEGYPENSVQLLKDFKNQEEHQLMYDIAEYAEYETDFEIPDDHHHSAQRVSDNHYQIEIYEAMKFPLKAVRVIDVKVEYVLTYMNKYFKLEEIEVDC